MTSGGADAGTCAAVAESGAGAAVGVAVATGGDSMYTLSGISTKEDGFDTPDPTVGVGEICGFRGSCHMTSGECTTLPVSASIILKQSLPRLYPKFRK